VRGALGELVPEYGQARPSKKTSPKGERAVVEPVVERDVDDPATLRN